MVTSQSRVNISCYKYFFEIDRIGASWFFAA